MYLLDTDTIIYNLKGDLKVQENLKLHVNDLIQISIITLMELYYGAYKSEYVDANIAKIKTLEQSLEILPTGQETAEIFGKLKSRLESGGNRLDDFDLIIASTALAHNLVLVTNNEKHFQRIEGLRLENWCI
ncbi:MAG: type II toxin-antitoxin system VapC family toxin [Proteobacteria bacterium]|nr:type II toxin-antitoxin system VapC family toxin [Pseudomonadota bacterium]